LPNLLGNQSNTPAPVLQTLNISQGVSQGLAIKKPQPSYPASALRMRIEGPVQLLATISKRGDISAVRILSGDPGLARAAADAVKQWKYKPYTLNGSPVEIQTQITVNFKLPR
jgi:protein TonB